MSGDTLERRANFRHDFSFHNWRWDAYHFFQGNVHSEFIDYDIIFFQMQFGILCYSRLWATVPVWPGGHNDYDQVSICS